MTADQETSSVRSGEELDTGALDRYLSDSFPVLYGSGPPEVRQFPGGHSNLTYLIRYGEIQFVLRRPPIGPVAATAHDMPREYRLLTAIHPGFPLAPKPLLLCEDTSVIGVPFYLMEPRRGFIVRSQLPESLARDPNLRRQLSESVVDTLIDLHKVDIHTSGLIDMGKPVGFVTRQVQGWANRWVRSQTTELPEMNAVVELLSKRIPAEAIENARIVHNDFKLDNVMLASDEPERVVAVLDWEMCAIGDPLIDLGLFLSYWTMNAGGDQRSSLRAITTGPGWLRREEIIERYQNATGRDLSQIVFYETFARFKVAVVIQQIYYRYVKGQTTDARFQHFDVLVRDLARDALELAQRSSN